MDCCLIKIKKYDKVKNSLSGNAHFVGDRGCECIYLIFFRFVCNDFELVASISWIGKSNLCGYAVVGFDNWFFYRYKY